jgi:hypothetical protein
MPIDQEIVLLAKISDVLPNKFPSKTSPMEEDMTDQFGGLFIHKPVLIYMQQKRVNPVYSFLPDSE